MEKKVKSEIKELKIHADNRGWLVELLKANEIKEPVLQLHIASIKPGQIRGNHYHKKRVEWLFVVAGKAELCLQDVNSWKKNCYKLLPGKPKLITVFPYVAHAIKNVGKEMVYLVSAQNDIYSPKNPDKFSWEVK